MPAHYRAAIIACGRIAEGAHLPAYRRISAIEVVAGADISAEVRQKWIGELGVPRMYADAAEMLERERPDIVSICTWPPLRPSMVELACAAGVKGIVAEKPMAVDLAGCDRMLTAVEQSGVVLIVGTMRRFHARYQQARALIDAGAIGDVVQVSVPGGGDLLTGGSHSVDLMRFLVHDAPAEWVIGQVDTRDLGRKNAPLGMQQWEETHTRYGHHVESGVLGLVQFQGGARGLLEGGIMMRYGHGGWPSIVYGTEGWIEVGPDRPAAGQPWLRARVKGQADWLYPDVMPNNPFQAEIEALLEVLEHGGTHPLDGHSARAGQEILMAVYESARRRARIDLPLEVTESPFEAMVAAGVVS